ncbi:hypothetical protein KXW63_000726, partial [Aspergillus fumigatus]
MRTAGASLKLCRNLVMFDHAFGCCNNTRETVAIDLGCGHFARRVNQPVYCFVKVGDFERDPLPVVPALRASILSVDVSKTTPARKRKSSFWEPCCNLLHDSCGVMLAAKDGSPAFIVILQE